MPIDLDTVSEWLLGFPSLLILWKARDDGTLNWRETVTRIIIFGLTIHAFGVHG